MSIDIVNCSWQFRFECPRKWDALTPTATADTRFCETCKRSVTFCHSDEELAAASKEGRCVAFEATIEDEVITLMGDVMPKSVDDSDAT